MGEINLKRNEIIRSLAELAIAYSNTVETFDICNIDSSSLNTKYEECMYALEVLIGTKITLEDCENIVLTGEIDVSQH